MLKVVKLGSFKTKTLITVAHKSQNLTASDITQSVNTRDALRDDKHDRSLRNKVKYMP